MTSTKVTFYDISLLWSVTLRNRRTRKVEFYKRMRCHSGDFVRFCIQSDCCSCCQNKQDGGRRISSPRRKSGLVFANFLLSTLENVSFQHYKLFLRIVFFTSLSDKIHKNTLNLSWTLNKTFVENRCLFPFPCVLQRHFI